jgi:hypothetical protein
VRAATRVATRERTWHRLFMRLVRRLGYPLRLAVLRLSRRASTALLAAVGVAAGAAMLAAVLAGSLIAQDRSVGLGVRELPAEQQAVRAVWGGLPSQGDERRSELDRGARDALRSLTGREPAALVLFREGTIAGRFLGLGAVDGLDGWVTLRSGRLPRTCSPERCEVVRLRGAGRIPNVPGLRLVQVGEGVLRSPVLFGDFLEPSENERSRAALSPVYRQAARYHRPAPAPLVLAEGVEGLVRSPEVQAVHRAYSWVVPLEAGSVRAWEIERFPAAVVRARSALRETSSLFEITAPVEELRAAGEAAEVSGRRLLLIGGEAAALLFAFAVLAAVAMRRDAEAARLRLTWYGARKWQLDALLGAETALIALAGTAVGWTIGSFAAWVTAEQAGIPPSEVLRHSTLSSRGLLLALGTTLALALVLWAAVRMRPLALGSRSFSPLDAAALGAVAAIAIILARGDFDQASLAGESGSAAALVVLPGLVTFAAAVLFARLFRPALLGLERLARRRSVSLRLAALSLARHPGHAAVAIAFLVVSVGLAVFAESYRTTLARGQEEQAAYAVPLDFVLKEDLSRLIPVAEAVPPERFRALGSDVQVEPVLRLSGNVGGVGGTTGIGVLGLDAQAIPDLHGWQEDFAAARPEELARRLEAGESGGLRGPRFPADATALVVTARGRGLTLTAIVQNPRGDFTLLQLGETEPSRERLLRAPVPPEARGGRLVAVTLVPPRIQERGAEAGQPFEGTLALGPLRAETPGGRVELSRYEDWIGVDGAHAAEAGSGVLLRYTLTEQLSTRFRPRQASDAGPVPVLASPGVAAAAVAGRLPLQVAGEQVSTRVVAVASAFPGTRGEFVVADRELLGAAVNTERAGLAVPGEIWLGSPSARVPALEARLARSPFDVLAVTGRAELLRSLRHDPLARGALLTLVAAALVALLLALVGILLGVLSDLRDERGELFDLEAQGAGPAVLRRFVRVRGAVVAVAGVLGGIATAAVLSLLVVDLVAVTAEAQATELPLRPAVDWLVLAIALGGGALVAAVLVAAASRRA